jgi:hypothetical protein
MFEVAGIMAGSFHVYCYRGTQATRGTELPTLCSLIAQNQTHHQLVGVLWAKDRLFRKDL